MNKVLKEDIQNFIEDFPFLKEVKKKSFLITGATGLLGSIIVRIFLTLNDVEDSDIKIFAIARNKEKANQMFGENEKINWIYTDIINPLPENLPNIDYIFHLASPTGSKFFVEKPVETLESIILGTKNILSFSREHNCRSLVLASSLEVYGTNLNDNLIAEYFQGIISYQDVRSSYNIAKRTAEFLCKSYNEEYQVPVKIARLTQTFGSGVDYNDNRVFMQFCRKIIENENIELHSKGGTKRMYCYTTDAIMALFYILIKGKNGEEYNVANPETYISIKEMAMKLKDNFMPEKSVNFNYTPNMGYAPETHLRLDTSKISSLGWLPKYDLIEMYKKLVESFKQ